MFDYCFDVIFTP